MASPLSKANSPRRPFPLEHTRNIGIAAHIDAGKTTTTERILFYTGVIHKIGEVHEGTAVTDWMEQERERGITITAAAISCNWTNRLPGSPFASVEHKINLIDTPGHVDFTAEVERSLRVLDGAVAVFCAVAGVQPQSETVWRQMDKYHVPRVAFVNKMDRMGASFHGAIQSMRERLRANAHALYLPLGESESFSGLIDLVRMSCYRYDKSDATGVSFKTEPIPGELLPEASEAREKLVEALCDFDDALADTYLEGKPIDEKHLRTVIRKATLSRRFVPVIPGSAFRNKGVQMLLDCVVDYLPSPLEVEPMQGETPAGRTVTVSPDDKAPVIGLAFKLWTDSYVGKLVFFRIYSGTLEKGSQLLNTRTRKVERVGRLMLLKSNDREDIDVAFSGDICAIIGAREIATGDTLCDRSTDLRLEPPTFPDPVISMSIEPDTKADQDKLAKGLASLKDEDPTFKVSINEETGQTLISGMGELHLEIIRDRLFREFKVQASAGKPQISYRETITRSAQAEHKFIRQTGGKGQYGHGVITIEPLDAGKGNEFLNKTIGGVIPKEFIKPFEEGVREAARTGVLAGFPLVDWRVCLIDGSFHEVDSSELAFRMAGIFAMKEAVQKALPILLEPIMSVEVTTPEDYQGTIVGDLNRRRGQIHGIENRSGFAVIKATVPLESMFGYSTDVRSFSEGRASYSMTPSHFDQVPPQVLKTVTGLG